MGKEKVKQVKTVVDNTQRFVYLGPNLTKYGLIKYSIFKGGLPELQAGEAFERWPLFRLLFVQPIRLTEAEKAIQAGGTPENEAIKQVMAGGEI